MKTKILIFSVALILSSCKTTPPMPQLEGTVYQVPVEPAKVEQSDAPKVEDPKESPDTLVITVPPSNKPTHIEVSRKTGLKQKAKEAMSNAPKYDIKSDNPNISANQPKQSVWWRWCIAIVFFLLIVLAIISAIIRKFTDFSPLGILRGLIKK